MCVEVCVGVWRCVCVVGGGVCVCGCLEVGVVGGGVCVCGVCVVDGWVVCVGVWRCVCVCVEGASLLETLSQSSDLHRHD